MNQRRDFVGSFALAAQRQLLRGAGDAQRHHRHQDFPCCESDRTGCLIAGPRRFAGRAPWCVRSPGRGNRRCSGAHQLGAAAVVPGGEGGFFASWQTIRRCRPTAGHTGRGELRQAVQCAPVGAAFKTRAAIQLQAENPAWSDSGGVKPGAGRTKKRHQRHAQGGGNMHQAGVIGDTASRASDIRSIA